MYIKNRVQEICQFYLNAVVSGKNSLGKNDKMS